MALALKPKPKTKAASPKKDPSFDLIIIGGGPAGLTAAIYAARARTKVLLIEKMIMGGAVSTTFQIENYPGFPDGVSGMDLSSRLQDQVKRLGVEIVWGNVISIKNKKTKKEVQVDSKTLSSKAIIIATGTEAAKLKVKGEDEFRGRGVSYCATCDGAFYKDKNVMVVGGGNSAIEEALFLTRYAKKISIVHRRDELRADKILAERALADSKIYFFWHAKIKEIKGEKKVSEVILKDNQTGKELMVPIDGIFIYVGSKPNSEFTNNIVKQDSQGYIITDDNMKTSVDGIFAAGDIRAKSLRQIVTAAADGAIAAEAARKLIEEPQK